MSLLCIRNIQPIASHLLSRPLIHTCFSLDATPANTLNLVVRVICCSNPSLIVHPCAKCVQREANRVKKNRQARLSHQQLSTSSPESGLTKSPQDPGSKATALERADTPTAPSNIVVFNCPEMLDFSAGRVSLPLRIICYSSHHGEHVGFQYVIQFPLAIPSPP